MADEQYTYIVVGGGLAGEAAAEGIREIDKQGSILLIGAEKDLPYDRPPLSKDLWKGTQKIERIFKHPERYYQGNRIELRLGTSVAELDSHGRSVRLSDGRTVRYQKLLLATGGTPRRLDIPGGDSQEICYFRTVVDYRTLRPQVAKGTAALVIGNGFIGSEVAAALSMNGADVVMVFPGEYICQHTFPASLGLAINDLYVSKNVRLLAGDTVTSITRADDTWQVQTRNGQRLRPQVIVAGIGIVPNVSLAQAAGLKVENGIVVDAYLQTTDPNIYAAGDVARFPEAVLGARRLEHWDNAISQGKQAGRNMAGAGERFEYMPFFFSDLFEFGYEAVGDCDSRLETFDHWQEPNRTGVLYYLKDGRVQGIMTCGIFGKTDAAREIIRKQEKTRPDHLRGMIRPD